MLMFISSNLSLFQALTEAWRLCQHQEMNTTPTTSTTRREWVLTAAAVLEDGDAVTGKAGRPLQKLSLSYSWSHVHLVTQMRIVKLWGKREGGRERERERERERGQLGWDRRDWAISGYQGSHHIPTNNRNLTPPPPYLSLATCYASHHRHHLPLGSTRGYPQTGFSCSPLNTDGFSLHCRQIGQQRNHCDLYICMFSLVSCFMQLSIQICPIKDVWTHTLSIPIIVIVQLYMYSIFLPVINFFMYCCYDFACTCTCTCTSIHM